YAQYPHFAQLDDVATGDIEDVKALAKKAGKVTKANFVSPVSDFHMTNAICRASKVMAECSKEFSQTINKAAE
ncbi:MAG: NADH-quinone oxidoreductase subunit G, partial [Nitratireductor sp.]